MKINNIQNGEYTANGKFYFDSNIGNIETDAVEVLEMAYTLFDWAGMDFSVLDEINEKVEG